MLLKPVYHATYNPAIALATTVTGLISAPTKKANAPIAAPNAAIPTVTPAKMIIVSFVWGDRACHAAIKPLIKPIRRDTAPATTVPSNSPIIFKPALNSLVVVKSTSVCKRGTSGVSKPVKISRKPSSRISFSDDNKPVMVRETRKAAPSKVVSKYVKTASATARPSSKPSACSCRSSAVVLLNALPKMS